MIRWHNSPTALSNVSFTAGNRKKKFEKHQHTPHGQPPSTFHRNHLTVIDERHVVRQSTVPIHDKVPHDQVDELPQLLRDGARHAVAGLQKPAGRKDVRLGLLFGTVGPSKTFRQF